MAKKRVKRPRKPAAEIPIVGEIFEEEEADVIKQLLDVPAGSAVTIYIDSGGGSVYSALSITALLRARKIKAQAVVLGECSSATLLIFAACQSRLVTPRSVFLFHRVRWRSEKDVRSEEAANWASHFNWLEKEFDRYQASLFDVDVAHFDTWIQEGRFVLGAELVELGLAEILDV